MVGRVDSTMESYRHDASEENQGLLWQMRINSLFLGLAYLCHGIAVSVWGPAFLDLILIAQVNIETGAIIFSVFYSGYLTGCLVCGFLLERVNQDLLMFVSTFGLGAFIITPPWIPDITGMALMEACCGVCAGVVDTAVNTVCILIWAGKVGPYMQALHVLFAIGGLLAPLIVEPFLMENSNTSIATIWRNCSNCITTSLDGTRNGHLNSMNVTLCQQPHTMVQFAFLICGLIAIAISFNFIYLYFLNRKHDKWKRNPQNEHVVEHVKRTVISKVVYLILFALYFMIYCSIEGTILNFLDTFVVEYAKWSKADGAKLMSALWGSFVVSLILSVPIAKIISPWKMLFLDFIILLLTCISLCFLAHLAAILWAASALLALSIASIFPVTFTWTETDIMNVDGPIASMFLIAGAVGNLTSPLIVGYLFEHYTLLWFVWFILGGCILNILLFIVITILNNVQYGQVSIALSSDNVNYGSL